MPLLSHLTFNQSWVANTQLYHWTKSTNFIIGLLYHWTVVRTQLITFSTDETVPHRSSHPHTVPRNRDVEYSRPDMTVTVSTENATSQNPPNRETQIPRNLAVQIQVATLGSFQFLSRTVSFSIWWIPGV